MEHINHFKASVTAVLGIMTALWGWCGWLVLMWVLSMALDYISGTAKAKRLGTWSSSVARDGLWHKTGEIISVLVAFCLMWQSGWYFPIFPACRLISNTASSFVLW